MRYDIERKAGTDTGYTRIASINSNAAAFSMNSYSFRDSLKFLSPLNVRYRLKQILPGDSAVVLLDSTIAVTNACAVSTGITVSPNPVKNNIYLTINAAETIQKLSIGVYNILGQRLYYYEGATSAGVSSHTIPAAGLASGVYIVTVRDNRKIIFSTKVVK